MKILIPILILLVGCTKNDENNIVPSCIKDQIEIFKTSGSCKNSTVDEYLFQNSRVFVFDNNFCCCDYQSTVLGTNCDTLGSLGGLIGNTMINGENFSNAKFISNHWKK